MIVKITRFLCTKIEFYVLSLVNQIIPKNPYQIFIFDKEIKKDNVWAIAECLFSKQEMQKYKVYYYNNKLNKTFKNIKFINKKYPIFTQLRYKYILYSYRDDRFKSHRSARQQVIIDTTHGSPLKNIGYLRSNYK